MKFATVSQQNFASSAVKFVWDSQSSARPKVMLQLCKLVMKPSCFEAAHESKAWVLSVNIAFHIVYTM